MISLQPGDIFFVTNKNSFLSSVFRWAMGFWASHAGLVKEVTQESIYTVETSDFEVTFGDLYGYFQSEQYAIEIWRLPIVEAERILVAREAAKLDQKVYGYLQLISLGIRRFVMLFGLKIPNFIRQGLVCCHVVLYAYKASSLKPMNSQDPEGMDTRELYELVTSIPGADKIFSNR